MVDMKVGNENILTIQAVYHSYLFFLTMSVISGCYHPEDLGMANEKILDTQLSGSRETSSYPAPLARLTGPSGWRGGTFPFDIWYQVDFIKHAKVTSIKSQGESSSYYVKVFKLSYSSSGVDFREYVDVKRIKVG